MVANHHPAHSDRPKTIYSWSSESKNSRAARSALRGRGPSKSFPASSVRRRGLRAPRKMNRDQEAVGPLIRKFTPVTLESFMLALPHPETIVGLRRPVFQVVHDDLVMRVVAFGPFQNHFAFPVVHARVSFAGLAIHLPCEWHGVHVHVLPFHRI